MAARPDLAANAPARSRRSGSEGAGRHQPRTWHAAGGWANAMNGALEKLGPIGLGCGLLILVVAVSVASGIISGLGGTTVSGATAGALLLVVAGGGGVATVLIA